MRARMQHQKRASEHCKLHLGGTRCRGDTRPVAVNKLGNVSFRTNAKLKEGFEQALASRPEFNSATDFFENCMRALIQQNRQEGEIELPLAFVSKPTPAHLP